MYNITKQLSKSWKESGLRKGDLVLLHSDIKRTLYYYSNKKISLKPEDIFLSLLDAIGEEGTILFPCFDIEVSENKIFNIKESKSKMGILSEIARNYKNSYRTKHPIYSFTVIGKKKNLFYTCDDFTGVGSGSPFDVVYKNNGKIAVLNLSETKSMTFYHYVEKMHDVDHRHTIKFNVNYIDNDNNRFKKKYGYYARKRDEGVKTYLEPMSILLWKKKLYKGNKYNVGNGLRTIMAKNVYEQTSKIILSGLSKGMLYKLNDH